MADDTKPVQDLPDFPNNEEVKVVVDKNPEKKQNLLDSPYIRGSKMSSSLKERLKKSTRCQLSPFSQKSSTFISPVSSCISEKIIKSDISFETPKLSKSKITVADENISHLEDVEKCDNKEQLLQMLSDLKRQIVNNEEKFRKLKLVQQYQSKNRPEDLLNLIERWLSATQNSLRKLYEILPEPKSDFQGLISFLQIDSNMIRYSSENDTFI